MKCKNGLLPILVFLSLLLLSCALIPIPPVTVPPPTPWVAAAAATSTAVPTPTSPPPQPTDTATPTTISPRLADTATPSPTSTPTPIPSPSPPPHTAEPPGRTYVVKREQKSGDYVIQLWRNTASESFVFDNIVTISTGGQLLVRIENGAELSDLTGTDITGEGHPDAVIERFTGGAHCCFSTVVYDLGPTLTKVLETPFSNCGGSFKDLNGDGVAEFVTCDDLFAYVYCCYAGSPVVQVVLQYDPTRGYVPVSPHFAHMYADPIARHAEMAENAQPDEMCEWDGTTKCGVLPLVLDYLYSGQDDKAWSEFSRLYDYSDAQLLWAEIVQAIANSPLYTPSDVSANASWPPYYMLRLLTDCETDTEQVVGVLAEGQSPCDPSVLRRDTYWLETLLRNADLLAEDETLALAPEGCADNCRLDVMRMADGVRRGSVRLDTTMGYPGGVYRVNGVESEHWRLRGDLTWERVSQ